ncbi:MAG: hypothetical protein GX906_05300 [Clostridiales bacterium]|nr:hypothetical protein [Clostridiales bacterium]
MSKRRKIIFVVLAVVMVVALIASLAACGKKPKPPTPDPPPGPGPVANPGGEKLQSTVSYIESTLLKDLALGLGEADGQPQIRVAADISLDVDIDATKAQAALRGILGDEFAISEDVKLQAVIGVDVVLDKVTPANNIATINVAVANKGAALKNILSLCLKSESVDNEIEHRLYVGERLIHTGEMNWVKVDYPQVDYIDWVAGNLDMKGDNLLGKMKAGNFISVLKIGDLSVGPLIKPMLPNFAKPGEMLQLFTYSKLETADNNVHKYAINFKNISAVLENLKSLLGSIDVSGLFAGMDKEVSSLLNGAIGLVLGSDSSSEMNGLEQLLKGKIKPEDQPEISLKFYNDKATDKKLEGFGLSYDGTAATNAEKNNGVKFALDIKNLKVQNLKTSSGAEAKSDANSKFLAKVGLNEATLKATKPLSLQVEVDLTNVSQVAGTFKNLESAKVVVDIYPSAKLGWRKGTKEGADPVDYFAANVNQTYAEANFTYKKVGADPVETLVGVMDFAGTGAEAKGLKLNLKPVFDALGAAIPAGKENAFMKWNFDLSREIEKMIEGEMAKAGLTPGATTPEGLMLAPPEIGGQPKPTTFTAFGEFINEIIHPSGDGLKFVVVGDETKKVIGSGKKVAATKDVAEHYAVGDMKLALKAGESDVYVDIRKEKADTREFTTKKNVLGDPEKTFNVGKAIGGVKYILNNILIKAMDNKLTGAGVTVNMDKTELATMSIGATSVKSLFDSMLMTETSDTNKLQGLIGTAGIYWYNKDPETGAITRETLANFLNTWNLSELEVSSTVTIPQVIASIVGGEIEPDFWKNDGTTLALAFNRTNGLALSLELGTKATVGSEVKDLKAKVAVKVDILGREMPNRKTLEGWNDEEAVFFGANNYDNALTTEQHNAWKEVLNALLAPIMPAGFEPFKYQADVTLNAGDGNFGMDGDTPITEKKVAVNIGETVEELTNGVATFAVPKAPAGKEFFGWTFGEAQTFVFGAEGTVIPAEGLTLTAVFVEETP